MSDFKPILCLDFDGVLHSYTSGWKGADVIPDPPVPGAIEFVIAAVERFEVHIFSSRSNQDGGIAAMQGWLWTWMVTAQDQEAQFERAQDAWRAIQWPTYKPPAQITIDDRALTFEGNWPDLDELAAFKPWNKREPFINEQGHRVIGSPAVGALGREIAAAADEEALASTSGGGLEEALEQAHEFALCAETTDHDEAHRRHFAAQARMWIEKARGLLPANTPSDVVREDALRWALERIAAEPSAHEAQRIARNALANTPSDAVESVEGEDEAHRTGIRTEARDAIDELLRRHLDKQCACTAAEEIVLAIEGGHVQHVTICEPTPTPARLPDGLLDCGIWHADQSDVQGGGLYVDLGTLAGEGRDSWPEALRVGMNFRMYALPLPDGESE